MFRKPCESSKKILISGAGIAGLSLARQLKKLSIPFKLIEKKPSLFTEGAGIALPANAVKALRYIGLGEEIDRFTHVVNKIIYMDSQGEVLSEASLLEQPLSADKFVALHRHKFHDILRAEIEDTIHFNTTIKNMTQTQHGVLVTFDHLPEEEFSAVIGADGLHSAVRQLAFSEAALIDLGVTIWRWTCNYPTHSLQPTYMLGLHDIFMAYPIGKNEVYCYAHAYDPQNLKTKTGNYRDSLVEQFGHYSGIAKTLLNCLPENRLIIPGRLRSVAQPLFTSGRVALIGDAGHACSPMLQQGAACALEDVIALSELLRFFSVEDALWHYEKVRSERIKWITTSSDGPMKMLINLHPEMLPIIQQTIREKGPLNVQGWRLLLSANPLAELSTYIEKERAGKEKKSDHFLMSKL